MEEERYKIITYKGKSIIHTNLTNFNARTKEDLRKVIDETKAKIARQKCGTVLILTDVTGLRFDTEIVNMFNDYATHNKPYIKASAVVGITGLMQFVFYTMSKMALRDIHSFNSETEALDWLVEQ